MSVIKDPVPLETLTKTYCHTLQVYAEPKVSDMTPLETSAVTLSNLCRSLHKGGRWANAWAIQNAVRKQELMLINQIPFIDLPLYIGISWVTRQAATRFKERLMG